MPIIYYSGPPGSGKSNSIKDAIIAEVGLHICVTNRVSGVQEITNDLHGLREAAGRSMSLNPFFCEQDAQAPDDCAEVIKERRKGGTVAKRITDRRADYKLTQHSCFIMTYTTFMMLDLLMFAGWTLHMDEVPTQAVISGRVHNPAMWWAYEKFYDLVPIEGSDFSRLAIKQDSPVTHQDILRDPALSQSDKNLYARVLSPTPVFIKAQALSDLGGKNCDWYSAWTLAETRPFKSVRIAASDMTESLMYRACPVEVDEQPMEFEVSSAEIVITYYDDGDQRCSAHFFDTELGKANLRLIAEALQADGGVGFYSCNGTSKTLVEAIEIAQYVTPQIEGTNTLRHLTSCAYFYSAKTQDHEAIYTEVFEIASRREIGAVREGSAIYQFATRTKMRFRWYDGRIDVHLYDRQQAEELQAKLLSVGYPNTRIQHRQLDGFVDRPLLRTGPKPIELTPDERKERDRVQARDRKREERKRKKLGASADSAAAV